MPSSSLFPFLVLPLLYFFVTSSSPPRHLLVTSSSPPTMRVLLRSNSASSGFISQCFVTCPFSSSSLLNSLDRSIILPSSFHPFIPFIRSFVSQLDCCACSSSCQFNLMSFCLLVLSSVSLLKLLTPLDRFIDQSMDKGGAHICRRLSSSNYECANVRMCEIAC